MKKKQSPNLSLFPPAAEGPGSPAAASEKAAPVPAATPATLAAPAKNGLRTPVGERAATAPAPKERDVYTVTRLNREARMLLEKGLPLLWLEGEISNFSQPSSGHWYFSLKDANAQVRCAMFRQKNTLSQCVPANGLLVQARVRVSLYEPRGEYQLIVEHLEDAGEGKLRRQFELLKAKLERAGLFATERKRRLPALPRRIGVVTSPTGAAIRDILHILRRRFPAIPVLIYPTSVQGAAAAQEVAAAIQLASRRAECDVLIVARGGGSLEDLWAFNEEVVARAIFNCSIPVVTGIGHEVDFTIADFVADVRAPTPSGAAELTVPDRRRFAEQFDESLRRLTTTFRQQLKTRHTEHGWLKDRLTNVLQQRLKECGAKYGWLSGRLMQAHPGTRLQHQAQRLDDLERRSRLAVLRKMESCTAAYNHWRLHLWRLSPIARLREAHHRAVKLRNRLDTAIRTQMAGTHKRVDMILRALDAVNPLGRLRAVSHRATIIRNRMDSAINATLTLTRKRMDMAAGKLHAVSPLATLDRGYAIVTRVSDDKLLRSVDEAQVGDRIETQLRHGRLRAVIEEKKS